MAQSRLLPPCTARSRVQRICQKYTEASTRIFEVSAHDWLDYASWWLMGSAIKVTMLFRATSRRQCRSGSGAGHSTLNPKTSSNSAKSRRTLSTASEVSSETMICLLHGSCTSILLITLTMCSSVIMRSGGTFLQSVYSTFDITNVRVGFAKLASASTGQGWAA